jgi:7,8-dihydroneopterin aldolase/epimerase/oxygenase
MTIPPSFHSKIPKSRLSIKNLQLALNLGWTEQERAVQQTIQLAMLIEFNQPPQACQSDQLTDTICYANLIHLLQTELPKKSYRLIEHLGFAAYQLTKAYFPMAVQVNVNITKQPIIENFAGYVEFEYGDLLP